MGRLDNALEYAGPILYGAASWLAACRLTWPMRWLKADGGEGLEADPFS